MFADSTSVPQALDVDTPISISSSDHPTLPASEPALNNNEPPPKDEEPVTEAYYYQKLRESADRFAYQLSTSKYVDDVETTWRGFDDKKKELVITSAMRFISFDPDADFKRFDDLAMAAMTSVMLNIVRTTKNAAKKPAGNALLKRAVTFHAAGRDTNK